MIRYRISSQFNYTGKTITREGSIVKQVTLQLKIEQKLKQSMNREVLKPYKQSSLARPVLDLIIPETLKNY